MMITVALLTRKMTADHRDQESSCWGRPVLESPLLEIGAVHTDWKKKGNFQYFFLFIRLFKGYKEEEDYDYYDNYTADVEIDSIVQVCCVNLDGSFNIDPFSIEKFLSG